MSCRVVVANYFSDIESLTSKNAASGVKECIVRAETVDLIRAGDARACKALDRAVNIGAGELIAAGSPDAHAACAVVAYPPKDNNELAWGNAVLIQPTPGNAMGKDGAETISLYILYEGKLVSSPRPRPAKKIK